ncbi:MAG: hypothetical protein M1336_02110 [Deltaproteobacteria bacterium]|jgi:hypothetical protein|nr:hypothetical protein [Deltaproteobacteria bacterium]
MAKLSVEQIRKRARVIVAENPGGIRFTDLKDRISQESPETPRGTIGACIWNLDAIYPSEVSKPSRGLFKPAKGGGDNSVVVGDTEQTALTGLKIREPDFYEPFADWLKNDLNDATDVATLGRAGIKTKWGTPDVIGVYKPLAGNLIKFPLEIVSAEIKIDPQAPVVAFGQAVAYRLFSAKTYVAMPSTLTEEDKSRLDSLCMLFGVGFVLFDVDKNNPRFSIRVRAQRFSPDMFYVNEFADRLKLYDAQVFEQLFR